MLSCSVLSACVEVEDEIGLWTPLPEYSITYSDPRTASCFIESKTGHRFRVKHNETHKLAGNNDTVVRVFVDGKRISSLIYTRSATRDPGPYPTSVVEGVREGTDTLLPFKFTKLALTDDDGLATKDEQVVKHMGTIRVELHRATQVVKRGHVLNGNTVVKTHVLHERAKKATLDHSTAFGQPKAVTAVTALDATFIDDEKSPFITLEFNYRSGGLLEANGIKPAVPSLRSASSDTAPEAGTSNGKRKTLNASRSPADDDAEPAGKRAKSDMKKPLTAARLIHDDDDDAETEIQKLRREVEQLKQKVNAEKTAPNAKKGQVLELD